MDILVVGGLGQVGSFIAYKLAMNKKSDRILVLDADVFNNCASIRASFPSNVTVMKENIGNPNLLANLHFYERQFEKIVFAFDIDVEEYYSDIFASIILNNVRGIKSLIEHYPGAKNYYLTQNNAMIGARYADYVNRYVKTITELEVCEVPDLYGDGALVCRNDTFINGILYDFMVYGKSTVELHPFLIVPFCEIGRWCDGFVKHIYEPSNSLPSFYAMNSINLAHAVHWSLEGNEQYEITVNRSLATLTDIPPTVVYFEDHAGFAYHTNLTVKAVEKGMNPSFVDISNNRRNAVMAVVAARHSFKALMCI